MILRAVCKVYFVLMALLAFSGLLVLWPIWRSGALPGDLPLMLGGIGIYLFLGLIWWLLVERDRSATLLGGAVLAVPTAAYSGTAVSLLFAG